jgi:hypothetical protein
MIDRFAEFMARRKAWQIFVVLVAPMLAAQFVFAAMIPIPVGRPPDMAALDQLTRIMLLVGGAMFLFFLSWLLSIGWVSNRRVSAEFRPRARWFFAAPVYAIAYFTFASYFFPASLAAGESLPWLIFVMHILAMVAIFYVLGFTAKNIMMAERQAPVSFFDYSGPFFLLWFFPIGVWFVQPRVNRLVAAA